MFPFGTDDKKTASRFQEGYGLETLDSGGEHDASVELHRLFKPPFRARYFLIAGAYAVAKELREKVLPGIKEGGLAGVGV